LDFSLADHILPTRPEPALQKMAQSPLNGTTKLVEIEEYKAEIQPQTENDGGEKWCTRRLLYESLSHFHQFWLSPEHRVRVNIIAPGWGSVNLCQFTLHRLKLGYSSREDRGGSCG